MDAPLYPPATHFEQPVRLPHGLTISQTSIAELRSIPAAWAIIVKEIPRAEGLVLAPQLQAHLGNFSFQSLATFGVGDQAAFDRADVQLRALGIQK